MPNAADAPGAPAGSGFGRFARDSAVYASGSVAGKAIGLLLLPIVTRALGPADFGRLDLLSTLQSAATSVLLLGLDTGTTRLYPDLDRRGRARMFGTWLALTLVVVAPLCLAMALFRVPVSDALFGSPQYGTPVALTAMAILGATFQVVALTALRNHGRPGAYAAVSAGSLSLNGVLVVVLLARGASLTAVLLAMAIGMTGGAIAGLVAVRHDAFARPDRSLLRPLLVLGLPLVPAVAATWVAEVINRAILLRLAGADEVGYFSVAVRFTSVALLVVVGFQTAWQPRAFALGDGPAALRSIANDGLRILAAVCGTVVLLSAVSPELVDLAAGDRFAPALPAIGLSLVFAIGYAGYHIVTMASALSRRMRDLAASAAVAAGAGVALNVWWGGTWGSTGTAAAVAVGQAIGVGVGIRLARTQAPIPYDWVRMGALASLAGACALGASLPVGGAPPAVRAAFVILFGLALLLGARGAFTPVAAGDEDV
jgi:O-antigen/teichoic acid export membrane protein